MEHRPNGHDSARTIPWAYWRWSVFVLVIIAILLIVVPQVIVPSIQRQKQVGQQIDDAFLNALPGTDMRIRSQSRWTPLIHPGDSSIAKFFIDGNGKNLTDLVPAQILRKSTCRLVAPGFDVQETQGVRLIGQTLSCEWAVSPKHEGNQVLAFQMTVAGQRVSQEETIQVQPSPFAVGSISAVLGIITATVSLLLLLTGKAQHPELSSSSLSSNTPAAPPGAISESAATASGATVENNAATPGNSGSRDISDIP